MAPSRGPSMEIELTYLAWGVTIVTRFSHKGKKSRNDKKWEYHPRWLRHKKGVILEYLNLRSKIREENGENAQTREQREARKNAWRKETGKVRRAVVKDFGKGWRLCIQGYGENLWRQLMRRLRRS